MVITKDDVLKRVSEILGERNDDDAISFVEDLSDTLDDYDTKLSEDWKTKYEENDKAWREKYKARFFEALPEEHTDDISDQIKVQTDEKMAFEDLFETKEG